MVDARISADAVLAAIYAPKNMRRVILSPGTTLSAMGIEHYPHEPPHNYRAMKRVLASLFNAGRLARRPRLHVHFTHKEVAYGRVHE